jgi:hypothetical protein
VNDKEASYTWFEVGLRRPGGRSNIGAIRIQHNRVADPEFFEVTTRWDLDHSHSRRTWLQTLRPGDVIQIIPKANYLGWVNIIQEAGIKLEYQPVGAGQSLHMEPSLSKPITAYRYQQLHYEDQQIRLLVVEPGTFEGVIYARFETANLGGVVKQGADFHALSYCWGDSPERADIVFQMESEFGVKSAGGASFNVSRTVERAIRRLRREDKPLRIWIDALCINQVKLEERAQQVSIMGRIYSRAAAVHVWLDENTLGIKAALRVIRDIYNFDRRLCLGGEACQCFGTKHTLRVEDVETLNRKQGHSSFSSMWEIFNQHVAGFSPAEVQAAGGSGHVHLSYLMQSLFQHPWFQRVWVVQEAILSRRTLVHCGQEMIEWPELLMVNELLETPRYKDQAPNLRSQLTMPTIWSMLAGARNAGQARIRAAGYDKPAELVGGDGQQPLAILDVFLAALDLKATDPRDKLFALLAFGQETCIAGEIPSALRPDYNKPLANVVADFTRWWIEEYRSLGILSFAHCQAARAWQRTQCDNNLSVEMPVPGPSWAIGTDGHSTWSRMTLLKQFSFRSSGQTIPDERLIQEGSRSLVLRLRGHKIGEIVAVGHPPKSMIYPYRPDTGQHGDMPTVFHRMLDPCGYARVWARPGSNKYEECRDEDQWRSMYDNHVQAHVRYFPEPAPPTVRPAADGSYEQYQADELPACIGRCFFVASNGLYGLCPWTAREGDVITVLHGGSVPYLLRLVPQRGTAGPDEQYYELVGECFVDGIMNGEKVETFEADAAIFALL